MKTLKVLSALLTYPSPEQVEAIGDMRFVVDREALLPAREAAALHRLMDHLADGDLYERQEAYGLLFDRTRALSLHLFEHVHGESRDRGQAMVDLIKLYEENGYSPVTTELPDFLPLFLEYAASRPAKEAVELVGQPVHVIAALKERLVKRNSPYAAIMDALLALAKAKPDQAALDALRAEPDPEPDDLEALDAAWEEEEVRFGPSADACGKDGLGARLRAARRPAPGVEVPAPVRPVVTTSQSSRA